MASLTQWTWVWVDSGSWWWTGRPGVLWFMGLQRVRHDWATELNWTLWIILDFPFLFKTHLPSYCSNLEICSHHLLLRSLLGMPITASQKSPLPSSCTGSLILGSWDVPLLGLLSFSDGVHPLVISYKTGWEVDVETFLYLNSKMS